MAEHSSTYKVKILLFKLVEKLNKIDRQLVTVIEKTSRTHAFAHART